MQWALFIGLDSNASMRCIIVTLLLKIPVWWAFAFDSATDRLTEHKQDYQCSRFKVWKSFQSFVSQNNNF